MGADNANGRDETVLILLCRDDSKIEMLEALARDIEAGVVHVAGHGTSPVRCLALVPSDASPEQKAAALTSLIETDERLAEGRHQVLVVDDHALERRAVEILGRRMRDSMVLACPPRDDSYDLRVERMRPDRPWEDNKLRRMGRPRMAKGRRGRK